MSSQGEDGFAHFSMDLKDGTESILKMVLGRKQSARVGSVWSLQDLELLHDSFFPCWIVRQAKLVIAFLSASTACEHIQSSEHAL